ncbi:MAG: DUF11 domain-containing protein, partial [Anaerolineae bacterium]|nr:DUF11 domain-containing protein [Anaerolineae bacterium]
AIQVIVKSEVTGSFTNTVEIIQSNTFDPNPSLDPNDENANAAEHTAYAVPDLVVEITADDYRIESDPPQIFTYTISVRNDSDVTANDVVITGIELSDDVTYISHTVDAAHSFDLGTGVWDLNGNLAKADGTKSMTITVQVKAGTAYGTFLPLTATASAPAQDDANISNNTGTIRVKVVSPYGDSGCHPSPDAPDDEVLCLTD